MTGGTRLLKLGVGELTVRERLSRGKRTYNGKWVKGDVFHYESGEVAICSGFSRYGYEATELFRRDKVIPETVGDYIGITDRNNKMIFEGDIIKYSTNKIGIVNYGTACFCVQDIKSRNNPAMDIVISESPNGVEIVGNIYDNPEMLEV